MKPKVQSTASEPRGTAAFLSSAPEISVFVACCVMLNELSGLQRARQCGEIRGGPFQEKSKALLERLGEAVEATQRFDVVLPLMPANQFSPFFWRWFNWWDDFLKALTPSQVAETERRARERTTLIENLRPAGHWIEYRSAPPTEFSPNVFRADFIA